MLNYNSRMDSETAHAPTSADEQFLAIKVVMMPADTNPQGTIFGGVVLSHLDLAGSVAHSTRFAWRDGRDSR